MAVEVAIVGAGIAGASLAWFLAPHVRVTLVEGESQPGYHTTGRSAAFYAETYGGPAVQPLTTAAKTFFEAPPAGFSEVPLLTKRGGLHVATNAGRSALAALAGEFAGSGVRIEHLSADMVAARVPQLRANWRAGALWEPDCRDIDVAALHQGFLTGARRAGARLICDARVRAAVRGEQEWRLMTSAGEIRADILVNAAGAWGDELAGLAGVAPLGLMPMRRTVVAAEVEPLPSADLPLVIAADGSFYFKPDAARLWISPHDETPAPASDVQPEEIDVALALARLEQATTFRVRRVERAWAGLRTFAPGRAPVFGYDPTREGFFWCVGQGGFGIQTAPAAGRLAAALLLGRDPGLPGVAAERYFPRRLETR